MEARRSVSSWVDRLCLTAWVAAALVGGSVVGLLGLGFDIGLGFAHFGVFFRLCVGSLPILGF